MSKPEKSSWSRERELYLVPVDIDGADCDAGVAARDVHRDVDRVPAADGKVWHAVDH